MLEQLLVLGGGVPNMPCMNWWVWRLGGAYYLDGAAG